MKQIVSLNTLLHCNSCHFPSVMAFLFLVGTLLPVHAQDAVQVGSGSYAAFPPAHEGLGDFASSPVIDVAPERLHDPIPTNDWWTTVLTEEDAQGNRHGGVLWTYPLVSQASSQGVNIGHRTRKNWITDAGGSRSLPVDYLITLGGEGFAPTKTLVTNWSDWHVDLETRVGDDDNARIEWTLGQGMPYVWARCMGFDPQIHALHTGVRTYYAASGEKQSFPASLDRFAIEYAGNFYGIHFPEAVRLSPTPTGLAIDEHAGKWIVVSALNQVSDLDALHAHAFVRPKHTRLDYRYLPEEGNVKVSYRIQPEVLAGTQSNVLQGFIPHHYADHTNQFDFRDQLDYTGTPRGRLKLAEGTEFSFHYPFHADLLPHFNVPEVRSDAAIPFDPARMDQMINDFAAKLDREGIEGGTYWGGKNLLRVMKYALIAKECGNKHFEALLTAGKAQIIDWLTYTPGETEFYYAYYPAWKALVGFNEEYGSSRFTDHHFHYGYLAHACALLEIAEPGAMQAYWPMITKVIQTYANWDRSNPEFPYFRTFSPWMGHSFAAGLGSIIGNNQESSSEAMQSWVGMFMVGEMTSNTGMRDAAAFGYLMESRAIAAYWYNDNGVFDELAYDRPITGILEMNRYVYGTFFGAQESYIHGIQWLPITPAFGFWNDFLTPTEANAIVDPIIDNMAPDLDGQISPDWMNVALGFKLFFAPEEVVRQFEDHWKSAPGSDSYAVAHTPGENGITYYYSHACQNLGLREGQYRLSLPLSSAFERDGKVSYVVYNPSNRAQNCRVYRKGKSIASFKVPAQTLYTHPGTRIKGQRGK